MGSRRKARECALQMLFAADVSQARVDELVRDYWSELGDAETSPAAQEFATRLATGTLARLESLDERIRSRAEHWRISRMAIVDRNILRLAVYEFLTSLRRARSPSTKRWKSPAGFPPTRRPNSSTASLMPSSAIWMKNTRRRK